MTSTVLSPTRRQAIGAAQLFAAELFRRNLAARLGQRHALYQRSVLTQHTEHHPLIVSLQKAGPVLTAITQNAAAAVRDKAGCLRFDVMEDAQRPTHYFYEIYRDAEAFGEYKTAPHFAVWRRAAGECVVPGSRILTLETLGAPVDAVVYIPAQEGKKVLPGMRARISPSTVRVEEYGYIIGEVRSVADFPSTPEGLERTLRNSNLVQALSGRGAPIEVVVRLGLDTKTPSGFDWSSSQGPPVQVFTGTLCAASVEVAAKKPAEYVLPFLKQLLGTTA